ncbi:MAG: hypothetical protein A2Y38_15695 [Spirochaetes bacterium GWB1_59_5]|nr:MAG: hypothetical protein A2Y38_15695 [Spirochaetes bacterium GWB1_59_5]
MTKGQEDTILWDDDHWAAVSVQQMPSPKAASSLQASNEWLMAAKREMANLMNKSAPFTADELRKAVGVEPPESKLVAQVFGAYAKVGLIQKVEVDKLKRTGRKEGKGRVLPSWEGVATWQSRALAAIRQLSQGRQFTADDIRQLPTVGEAPDAKHNKMGPLMILARESGLIRSVERQVRSSRPGCGRSILLWERI